MKITVLMENTSEKNLIHEHGLSLFIEFEGRNYLLDTGQSSAFLDNASKLGISLNQTNYCILSHGHYDHSGGFASFFETYSDIKVYAMTQAKEDYYSTSGGHLHSIGIPDNVFPRFEERFCFIDTITELAENVYLLPHSTPKLEQIGNRAQLYKKVNDELLPDDFAHELSLVFDTPNGLVVFNSCSHAGICNILEEVKTAFPTKPIYAFVGGLHMKGTRDNIEICTFSEEEIKNIADYLRDNKLHKLYTGHCTGQPGFEMLQKHLKNHIDTLSTGKKIEL